jgi:hypothetical protein
MTNQLETDLRQIFQDHAANAPLDRADEVTAFARRSRRRYRLRRRGVVLFPIVLVVVVVTAILVSGGKQTVEFASWSATPTPPAPRQVSSAETACIPLANQMSRLMNSHFMDFPHSWKVVGADVRGPYTLVVLEGIDDPSTGASCLTGPGFSPQLTTFNSNPLPAPGRISLAWGGNASPEDTVAVGPIGAGVTGVVLDLQNGSHVTASVVGRVCAAWWPGRGPRVYPASARLSTAHGTKVQSIAG